jgi:hypothetical protein
MNYSFAAGISLTIRLFGVSLPLGITFATQRAWLGVTQAQMLISNPW